MGRECVYIQLTETMLYPNIPYPLKCWQALVRLIQTYMDGGYVYIPRKRENRKSWGESSRAKEELRERNREIFHKHRQGTGVKALAEEYFLSEKGIQRIVLGEKKKHQEKKDEGSVPD